MKKLLAAGGCQNQNLWITHALNYELCYGDDCFHDPILVHLHVQDTTLVVLASATQYHGGACGTSFFGEWCSVVHEHFEPEAILDLGTKLLRFPEPRGFAWVIWSGGVRMEISDRRERELHPAAQDVMAVKASMCSVVSGSHEREGCGVDKRGQSALVCCHCKKLSSYPVRANDRPVLQSAVQVEKRAV